MSYSEAVVARTARACDSCLRCRARWFCDADDAFLCQACDVSVHSANPLSRRHHRIRLKTASSSSSPSPSSSPSSPQFSPPKDASLADHATPAWLHGLKRKPRTPRGKLGLAGALPAAKVEPLVPDLEDSSAEENQYQPNEEEQLLHCVPILDPVLTNFGRAQPLLDDANASGDEVKPDVHLSEFVHVAAVDDLAAFRRTDLELAEFASDMEILLGRGLDDDSFFIDGLGLADAAKEDASKGQVKVEMHLDAARDFRMEIALSKDALDLDFDCRTPMMAVDVEEHKPLQDAVMASDKYGVEAAAAKRRMILRLDYEAVIAAWSFDGCSPWIDGERPQLDPNDAWPDFPAMGGELQGMYQQVGQLGHMAVVDEGREARVSRYREKRRTRLFSKKIRYEVRKLNAEKRPRMKGRFVKRAAFTAAAATAATLSYR